MLHKCRREADDALNPERAALGTGDAAITGDAVWRDLITIGVHK